jgi:arginine/ornithine N-succinyltransferase beta subunit
MNMIDKYVYVKNEGYGRVVGYDYGTYIIDLKEGGTVHCTIDKLKVVEHSPWEIPA